MKNSKKNTFRRIRRIVGISALCLGIAIGLVPANLFASQSANEAPEDNLTVTVSDERASVSGLSEKSTATALNFDKDSTLKIQDSTGETILALMNEKVRKAEYDENLFYKSDQMSAFSLGFYDGQGTKKDYGTLDLTLVVPESFRRDGFLEVVGVSGDGNSLINAKIEASTAETKSITFVVSGSTVPSGEFMLLSHKAPVTTVNDQRTDTKNGSKSFASLEKDLYVDRVLNVESKGNTIQKLIDDNGSYAYDDLSVFTMTLTDEEGTEILKSKSDYGKLSVNLAIPDRMKLSEGRIKLFRVNEDKTLNTDLSEKTDEVDGVSCVAFQTDITGEFAIAYFSDSKPQSALTVIDTRTDCSKTAKTTVSAKTEYTGQLFLHVEPSEGAVIKPLIQANGTYHYTDISPFKLTMTDAASGGKVVASPPTCTLTMVLPDLMDDKKGRVYLLGIAADGTLNGNTGAVLTDLSGETYITFETAVMNEYAFLYDAGERYPITTKPADETMTSESVSASVSNGSSTARFFVVKELTDLESKMILPDEDPSADPSTIQDRKQAYLYGQVCNSDAYRDVDETEFYDFYLADSEGNPVDDFGTCTIKLVLSDSMDPSKGKIQVLSVKTASDDTLSLDTGIGSTTESVDGNKILSFTVSHFTPFSVLYTENKSKESGTGGTGGASAAGPATNVTPVIMNDTSKPSPPTGSMSGSITPATQNTAAASAQQGNGTGTVADMPKTADATTYRNILVMILISLGALLVISSFRFEKTVRRRKRD